MIVGLGTIVSFVLPRLIYDELDAIRAELTSRGDVEAYQFSSYEGKNYDFEIWLKGGGYISASDIDKEDFQNSSYGPVFQIGHYRINCFSQELGKIDKYGQPNLFGGIRSLNVALNDNYAANLHDLISNYAAIENMVSAWPGTEESAFTFTLDTSKYPDTAPDAKTYHRICWQEEMQQPRVPRDQKNTQFYLAPYEGKQSRTKEHEE